MLSLVLAVACRFGVSCMSDGLYLTSLPGVRVSAHIAH